VDRFNMPCKLFWITHYFVAFHPAAKHPNIMVDRELRNRRNQGGESIKNSDNLCSFQNHLKKVQDLFEILMGLYVSVYRRLHKYPTLSQHFLPPIIAL
jgi:hypothetical protein